jgi:hypothetical protein
MSRQLTTCLCYNLLAVITIVCVVTQQYKVTFAKWYRYLKKIIMAQSSKNVEVSINNVTTITDTEIFRFLKNISRTLEKLTSDCWMWSCFFSVALSFDKYFVFPFHWKWKFVTFFLNKVIFHCSGKLFIGEPWHDIPSSVLCAFQTWQKCVNIDKCRGYYDLN